MIFDAPGNFGTKDKIVAFADVGRNPDKKKCLTAITTSSPTTYQAALKKPDISPSGPGALLGLSLKTRNFISSGDGMVRAV